MHTQIQKRPAFYAAIALAAGILFGGEFHSFFGRNADEQLIFAGILLVLLTLLFAFRQKTAAYSTLFLVIFLFAGNLRFSATTENWQPANHISHQTEMRLPAKIQGWVFRVDDVRPGTVRLFIELDSVTTDGTTTPTVGGVAMYLDHSGREVKYGDEITSFGELRIPYGKRNPGGYDYAAYLKRQSVFAEFRSESDRDVKIISAYRGSPFIPNVVLPTAKFLERRIEKFHSGIQREFLKAVILGKRSGLDPEAITHFKETGTLHILAVSGLHVGFVYLVLRIIFTIMLIPKRRQYLLIIPALIVYIFITGGKPPVVRASLFLVLFISGGLLQRYRDALNLLGVTAVILLLIEPLDLFDPGFQLSFAAVGGILLFSSLIGKLSDEHRPIYELMTFRNFRWRIIELVIVSAGAFTGTSLVMAYHFNTVSPTSIFFSVLFIPVTALIVGLGFFEIIVGSLIETVGTTFANSLDWLITNLLRVNKAAAGNFDLDLSIPHDTYIWVVMFFTLALFFIKVLPGLSAHKKAITGSLVLLCVITGLFFSRTENRSSVTFLDVGQGDCALITFEDGSNWMIDGGDKWGDADAGQKHVVPFLRWAGITHLDGIILSHANRDHYGGLVTVMEAVTVDTLYVGYDLGKVPGMKQFKEIIAAKEIPLRVLISGDRVGSSANWRMTALLPGEVSTHPITDMNRVSLNILLNHRGTKVLFTGDIGFAEENKLLRFGNLLNSEVLKLPHHGSKYSASSEFLQAVSPELGVISVGRFNQFGHPAGETLNRIKSEGIKTVRLDRTGYFRFELY